jgi:carboxyl-terminal processing protease
MAWELVRDTHYDTEYNGVDWQGVRDELRPRAEAARTQGRSRELIGEMVGRLNQSHFGVIPSDLQDDAESDDAESSADDDAGVGTAAEVPAAGDGDGAAGPGFDFRVIGDRAVVTRIEPGGPAEAAGVRMGWVLDRIRGRDVTAVVERMAEAVGEREAPLYIHRAIDGRLQGRAGTPIGLTFLNGADEAIEVSIDRVVPPGRFVTFGNLPALSTNLEHRWLTPEETGDADAKIGYIAFNIFMIPIAPLFERAMVEFQDAEGIVIDLRGNPGGVGGMAPALARYFVTEKSQLGTMTMRGAELQFNAEPVVVTSRGERLRPFTGPLAIVIDGTSASTSEVFAGGLRAIDRAKTFGSRSAGMALPAAMSRLPSGDVLLHAIADYVNSDGTRLEGDGVPTDFAVPLERDDLLRGIDAPLREAARWIGNMPQRDAMSGGRRTSEE